MGNKVVRFYNPEGENGYLSNWYKAEFCYAGRVYHSSEQYLMEQKALTFGDVEIAEKIMASDDLNEIKKLGRKVARYNDALWKTIRGQIMRRGIRAKFQQNPELLYNLLSTGNALIVECAPRDMVWGIGVDMEDSRSMDPKEWKGRNLLGRTLMRVREDLRAWCAVAGIQVTTYVDAWDLHSPEPVKVSRRGDDEETERLRTELKENVDRETSAAFGISVQESEEGQGESSIWNMHIYEAVMLPYVSEIVSTWMEEVFFNLRRSRSYEDLGVANYTFEELEWMLREGHSAGLPVAGFFEMKQDLFDLMRYQGGLRNPAALLAQIQEDDFDEMIPDTEKDGEIEPEQEEAEYEPAEAELPLTEFLQEERYEVVFTPGRTNVNRIVRTDDPGTTSTPDMYLKRMPETTDEVQSYIREEGEEETTSIGSSSVERGPLWTALRYMEAEENAAETFDEPANREPAANEDGLTDEEAEERAAIEASRAKLEALRVELEAAKAELDAVKLSTEDTVPAEPAAAKNEDAAKTVEVTDENKTKWNENEASDVNSLDENRVDAGADDTKDIDKDETDETRDITRDETDEPTVTNDDDSDGDDSDEDDSDENDSDEDDSDEDDSNEDDSDEDDSDEDDSDDDDSDEDDSDDDDTDEDDSDEDDSDEDDYDDDSDEDDSDEDDSDEDDSDEDDSDDDDSDEDDSDEDDSDEDDSDEDDSDENDTDDTDDKAPNPVTGNTGKPNGSSVAADVRNHPTEDDSDGLSLEKIRKMKAALDDDEEEDEKPAPTEFRPKQTDDKKKLMTIRRPVKSDSTTPASQPIQQVKPQAPQPAAKPQPVQQVKPQSVQQPVKQQPERSELIIKHGNIASLDCDCLVNATNASLLGGNGFDNSIVKEAGPEMLRECASLRGCEIGRAKITGGYRLKASYVIHTVGPKYTGDETDPVYLTMCYENCLNLAMKYDIHSIAFPPISTGYLGYPLREATMIANRSVQGWMRRHPDYTIKVIFVSADERTFSMYRDILK